MASKKPLITLVMDEELLEDLDDYRFGMRFGSRGAAIRYLLRAALDQKPWPEPDPPDDGRHTVRLNKHPGPILPRATDHP